MSTLVAEDEAESGVRLTSPLPVPFAIVTGFVEVVVVETAIETNDPESLDVNISGAHTLPMYGGV